MTKQAGLGDNLYVAGYNISGDVGSIERIGGGPALLPVTGIDKSGIERVGGQRDGMLDFSAFFNKAVLREHVALSPLPTADVQVMYLRGTTLGNPAAAMIAKQINYDPTRGADGSLTEQISAQANGFGLEWGRNFTAGVRQDSSATDGTGVDSGAGTSFGLQAYLQVFAFTGTSVTVKLQESSDDASGDAYADVTGGGFAAASGIGTERIATTVALSVERWLRVITTGTFTVADFAVVIVRNLATPVF